MIFKFANKIIKFTYHSRNVHDIHQFRYEFVAEFGASVNMRVEKPTGVIST